LSVKFSLRLFGKLDARINNIPMSGLHLRDGERLLAYFALHPDTPHTYRQLAQQFWPSEAHQNEVYDGGSYPSTRQAIHALRRALGDQAWRLSNRGKGVVAFDLADAEVDCLEFDLLVQEEDTAGWQRALELHCAPLLEGWNEAWVQEARARRLRSRERIARALVARLGAVAPLNGEEPSGVRESVVVEADGGAVALNSPFYIDRATDTAFREALLRRDSIVLVKGARQTGKTSLLARGAQAARKAGRRVLVTDFHSLPAAALASADALYRSLAQEMVDQLELDVEPEAVWNVQRTANRNLERFLCSAALRDEDPPLVWAMDEVDRLFTCDCGSEVFGLLRSWHNRRALDPEGPWARLTLAMSYSTEAHLFIRDVNQSPFNVGTRVTLNDFTMEQVAELNRRYGSPLEALDALRRFYALLHGHPYLTRRALSEMHGNGLNIDALEAQADRSDGLFGDHLRRLLAALTNNAELTGIVRALLQGRPCNSEAAFYRLRSAGVLTGDAMEHSQWRCPIYAAYLKRHLGD
jgi:hypothetical protein